MFIHVSMMTSLYSFWTVANFLNFIVIITEGATVIRKENLNLDKLDLDGPRLKRDTDNDTSYFVFPYQKEQKQQSEDYENAYNWEEYYNDLKNQNSNISLLNPDVIKPLNSSIYDSINKDLADNLEKYKITVDMDEILPQRTRHSTIYYSIFGPITILCIILRMCFYLSARRTNRVIMLRTSTTRRTANNTEPAQAQTQTQTELPSVPTVQRNSELPPQYDDPPKYDDVVVNVPQNIKLV